MVYCWGMPAGQGTERWAPSLQRQPFPVQAVIGPDESVIRRACGKGVVCVCKGWQGERSGRTVKRHVPGHLQLIIQEAGPEVDVANTPQSN